MKIMDEKTAQLLKEINVAALEVMTHGDTNLIATISDKVSDGEAVDGPCMLVFAVVQPWSKNNELMTRMHEVIKELGYERLPIEYDKEPH